MLPNLLKQRVQLQEKTSTPGALGATETWKPAGYYNARVIPLDVKTIASYQQLSMVVTHKVILGGTVDVDLGGHRFLHGAKIYEPAVSAQHLGGQTVVIVRES